MIACERRLDVSTAVRRRPNLLDNPSREPDGGVCQRKGQCLGPCALDPLTAGLLLEPELKLIQNRLSSGVGLDSIAGSTLDRHQVEVNAGQALRVGIAKTGGDERAPDPLPWGAEALIAQHLVHQPGKQSAIASIPYRVARA